MKPIIKAKEVFIGLTTTLALSSPAQSETGCIHDDFYSFLVDFQNNPSEQVNMSADQIEITTFQEMGRAMPARYTQTRSKNDLDWPILPSLTELNQKDLRVRIYQDTPSKAELVASTMDGREVYLMWYFEKDTCWTFVGFTDGTLHR